MSHPTPRTIPPRLRALIFDMDGTLLDSSEAMCRGAVAAVAALTNRVIPPTRVPEVWDVATPGELLARLLGRSPGSEDVETYLRFLDTEFVRARLYDHMEVALATLSRQVPLALYTGTCGRVAEMVLLRTKARRWFSHCVFGDDVSRFKPDPEGILTACHLLGVEPEATAYIGDSPMDVSAAHACGALAVTVEWGYRYDPDAPADVVLHSPPDASNLIRSR